MAGACPPYFSRNFERALREFEVDVPLSRPRCWQLCVRTNRAHTRGGSTAQRRSGKIGMMGVRPRRAARGQEGDPAAPTSCRAQVERAAAQHGHLQPLDGHDERRRHRRLARPLPSIISYQDRHMSSASSSSRGPLIRTSLSTCLPCTLSSQVRERTARRAALAQQLQGVPDPRLPAQGTARGPLAAVHRGAQPDHRAIRQQQACVTPQTHSHPERGDREVGTR